MEDFVNDGGKKYKVIPEKRIELQDKNVTQLIAQKEANIARLQVEVAKLKAL